MLKLPTYALVTPARNEEEFIELTIQSVISQTALPTKWVIVSDGSTDRTDEIVSRYAVEHPWIELIRMPERRERHFAGKVLAFEAGYAKVKELGCDVIGCLDGDISFDQEYFAFLLRKMADDSKLGLVGTRFRDPRNYTYDYRFVSVEHVTGCCQLFRRTCYEEIGGYVPAKGGAVDRIINISARMKGWKTRTFTEKVYLHHREMGTAEQGIVKVRFKDGAKDYAVGSHPLWEVFRSVYQMSQRPFLIGGVALLAGYLWQTVKGVERPVSRELLKFHRQEQLHRLKAFLTGRTLKSNV
jgi:poly-beta-1,6-N-acetyl-D-glucosamine synthase